MITVNDIRVGERHTFYKYVSHDLQIEAVEKSSKQWAQTLRRWTKSLFYPTWDEANDARIKYLREYVGLWSEHLKRAELEIDRPTIVVLKGRNR